MKAPVSTICIGQACSMGAFLLAAGEKGRRFCLPNARVMIHQPSGGFQGQAADMDIHVKEILQIRHRLNSLLAKHTGQPIENIEKNTDRDNFMSAQEAQAYGIVDSVIDKRAEGTIIAAGA